MELEFLSRFFAIIVEGMSQEITVYGFTFSYWGIMIFTAVADIVLYAIWRIFND